jgi:hypothetical protein
VLGQTVEIDLVQEICFDRFCLHRNSNLVRGFYAIETLTQARIYRKQRKGLGTAILNAELNDEF